MDKSKIVKFDILWNYLLLLRSCMLLADRHIQFNMTQTPWHMTWIKTKSMKHTLHTQKTKFGNKVQDNFSEILTWKYFLCFKCVVDNGRIQSLLLLQTFSIVSIFHRWWLSCSLTIKSFCNNSNSDDILLNENTHQT